MSAENKGNPSYFLDTFLSRPASSIPKGAQWAVTFDNLERNILPAIGLAYDNEPHTWQTEEAASVILTSEYQQSKGCLFCQAIGLPGEGMTPVAEGNIKHNAFIRSYVGAGRSDFQVMRMTFLETNVSFCDSFLRGWALATSNFGLIARSGEKNYRTNLTCYKFGITPTGPVVTMAMTFRGICCVNVAEHEISYAPVSSPMERSAQFIYHSYSVDTITGNSPDFLSNKPAYLNQPPPLAIASPFMKEQMNKYSGLA